jgi:hypothetical protein
MTKTVKYPSLEWIELVSQGWVTVSVHEGWALMVTQDPYVRFQEGTLACETVEKFRAERQ